MLSSYWAIQGETPILLQLEEAWLYSTDQSLLILPTLFLQVIPHALHPSLIPGYVNLLTGCAAVRFFHNTSGATLTVSRYV